MATFTKSIAAGNTYAFMAFINENGFMVGSATTAPSAGAAGSPMIRITGIKTASPTVPEPEVVQVTGDDTLLGEFDFDSLTQRSFTIEVAVQDLEAEALLLGTSVETVGQIKLGALDILNPAELNACLIIQSRAKKQDAGVVGQKGWNGVIIPIATVKPLGRDTFAERGPAVFRYFVTPQIAGNNPWGVTILDVNAGTTGLRYRPFTAENPITMHAHTGNGALQSWTLDYQPISAAKTALFGNRNVIAVSAVTTTAPFAVTTVATAPIGGLPLVTIYEFAA
jgi:hypothetical protein